jgi:hypothetical protein
MRDTGGKHITDTFRYKHHAILVPVVTAADCILEATHQFTSAIEGNQEAAPDKLQANESLRHVLLGKQIPQQPHPPPPTPLNDSNIDKEPIHMWDLTICAQPILPADASQKVPQTGRAIIDDDDAPPHPIPPVHTGSPAIIHDYNNVPPMVRDPQTQAQLRSQAESHLINMVIHNDHIPNFSLVIKPHKLHRGYLQAAQACAVWTYILGTGSSCFIGAIIDKDTGNILENCQLIQDPQISRHLDTKLCQ